jgi:hypothetical protein
MPFKFEKLEVWQLAMDLSNKVYDLIKSIEPATFWWTRS